MNDVYDELFELVNDDQLQRAEARPERTSINLAELRGSCQTCFYGCYSHMKYNKRVYECRKNPPRVIDSEGKDVFPYCRFDKWCGSFRKIPS